MTIPGNNRLVNRLCHDVVVPSPHHVVPGGIGADPTGGPLSRVPAQAASDVGDVTSDKAPLTCPTAGGLAIRARVGVLGEAQGTLQKHEWKKISFM